MDDAAIGITRGPADTVLPPAPDDWQVALAAAEAEPPERRRGALAAVAGRHPTYLEAWAGLSESARDPVEAYAYARVGYHRGLDALRANGWRGTGYVRFAHPSNLGFLRSLQALARLARALGETDEAERCELFLRQLDPTWRGGEPHTSLTDR